MPKYKVSVIVENEIKETLDMTNVFDSNSKEGAVDLMKGYIIDMCRKFGIKDVKFKEIKSVFIL